MPNEAQTDATKDTKEGKEAATPPPKEGAGQGGGTPAQAKPKDEPAKDAKDAKNATAREPRRLRGDDEIDELDDEELIQLSKSALKKRLNRHTLSEVRQRFGTDDLEKIAAELAELKTLREEKEARRKEQLSREERLEEEKRQARKEAQEARQALERLQDERDIADVDRSYQRLAARHLDSGFVEDPDLWEGLSRKLRKHLREETGRDARKVTEKMVEKFFEGLAKDSPRLARKAEDGTPRAKPVEVGIDSGSRAAAAPPGKEAAPGQAGQKTAKPGQPNSMTAAEIRAAGYKW